ncbi:glucose PTS transporter subunit IIA [Lactococcus allomyrinae]|uniref:PTS system sucrose-specific EIIBCA component n=1 Tax=Lactococcus allomyrinae TaxID=2419773 RepID=A0A387BF99_9LACT|nr:glucose PTS transporter subunit IIA [Lactococcus allomyrinae]AYG00782.1 PTS beta-glucoside transporter subunit EIIBCA [Lactococcus allomyrinae]
MADDKVKRIAREIYEQVGGESNVVRVIHCMTRVRMTIKDYSKVNMDNLKKIDGVLGTVNDETLQVIIGPGTVNKVAQTMVDRVGVKLGDTFPGSEENLAELAARTKSAAKDKYDKPSKFKAVLKSISNIFVPLIPALVGAGLIGGVASILSNLIAAGSIDAGTWQQTVLVLNILKNGIFTYLAIFTGINAATEFGATPSLGGIIGAATLLTGVTPDAPLTNIFTGTPLNAGQGGIIGAIFAVWLLSLLEKRLHKWVPDSIDIIVTPTLSLLIIGLATIFLIMPIAGWVSAGLVGSINWVLNVGGAFSGFILGAFFLPLVMFGLHQILTPIHMEMIAKTGSTQLLPLLSMAGGGQVGAAIALWIRLRKNKDFVKLVKGALPVGILGIGEPLIYGITLPMGRPFITSCIGGGIGGAVIGALGNAGAITVGPSGLALIPLIAGGRWWIYIIGLLSAYAGGFIATYFWGIPQSEKDKADHWAEDHEEQAVSHRIELFSPMNGEAISLSDVEDEAFSTGILGKGIAIRPTDGKIVSPVDGVVTMTFPTKHAVGITSDEGVEILIHIGLDTVSLEGKPFDLKISVGEHIKRGDILAEVDLDAISAAGLSTVTPIVVTNSAEYIEVLSDTQGDVQRGQKLLQIILAPL